MERGEGGGVGSVASNLLSFYLNIFYLQMEHMGLLSENSFLFVSCFTPGVSNYYKEIYRKKFCGSSLPQDDSQLKIKAEKLHGIDYQPPEMCLPHRQVHFDYDSGFNRDRRFKSCQLLSDSGQFAFERENERYGAIFEESKQPMANAFIRNNQNVDSSLLMQRQPASSPLLDTSKNCSSSYAENTMVYRSDFYKVDKEMKNYTVDPAAVKTFSFIQPMSVAYGNDAATRFSSNFPLSSMDHGATGKLPSDSQSLCFSDDQVLAIKHGSEFLRKPGSDLQLQGKENIQENLCHFLEEKEGTPCGTTPKRDMSISSKIARRLYEHKNRR